MLDLSATDLKKASELMSELRQLSSSALNFETIELQKNRIFRNLRTLMERSADNHQFAAGALLEELYHKTIELENIIGETNYDINARFIFWSHLADRSEELQTFSEFIEFCIDEKSDYLYFRFSVGAVDFLICQYVALDKPSDKVENLAVEIFDYIDRPEGTFRNVRKFWNKKFSEPDFSIIGFSPQDRQGLRNSTVGIAKGKRALSANPYRPHKHNDRAQLPKIIYDFMNLHGINGRRHLNLVQEADKSIFFLTRQQIDLSEDGHLELSIEETEARFRLQFY